MSRLIAVVVPIGRLNADDVACVTSDLARVFTADVVLGPPLPLPLDAFDSKRQQYLARAIVEALACHKRSEWTRLLGVVAEDLYAPDLNFVFGEADGRGGVALFSIARLRQNDDTAAATDTRFRRRVATEAIHELGHTYGLGHCPIATV